MSSLSEYIRLLRSVAAHPLNRDNRFAAVMRVCRWQLGTRLLPGAVAVPFVNGARLLATRSMAGAVGNVYCGLHEFADMAFLLHALRPGDLLADVGANIGSYSVLAATTGARALAFEPVPSVHAALRDNIALNRYEPLITARNLAVGASAGTIHMTAHLDAVNHVVSGAAQPGTIAVEVVPLDDVAELRGGASFLKIDVEGYEAEVVAGAHRILSSPELKAVVIELNAHGAGKNASSASIDARLRSQGLLAYSYDAFTRSFTELEGWNTQSRNTLYIRDLARIRELVAGGPRILILGREL